MNDEMVMTIEGPTASEFGPSEDAAAEYNEELENVTSVLGDVCDALAADGRVRFVVRFAGEEWPVDVRTDLLTVLAQLPATWKEPSEPFEIDFYEQGLERRLHFEPRDGELNVRCESWHATWRPPDIAVRMHREDVRSMLRRLVDRFVRLAMAARPNIARHPWFLSWQREASGA